MPEELALPHSPGEALVSAELVDQARAFAANARSPRTRHDYQRAWRAFSAWCQQTRQLALPAAPETVALYLTARATAGRKPCHARAGSVRDQRRASLRRLSFPTQGGGREPGACGHSKGSWRCTGTEGAAGRRRSQGRRGRMQHEGCCSHPSFGRVRPVLHVDDGPALEGTLRRFEGGCEVRLEADRVDGVRTTKGGKE
jgi:hypothetical protein